MFEREGWTVTSLDWDSKFQPTICCNILDVTPEMILEHGGRPDVIWASPLCTHYSIARTTAKKPRDLVGSDKLVQKVLDLVKHFDVPFFMENPRTGLLRKREVVKGIPMRAVDFCQYKDNDWHGFYRKPTGIWTNTQWRPERPLCNPRTCPSCSDGRYHDTLIGGRVKEGTKRPRKINLYSITPALPRELVNWLGTNLALNEE